MNVKYSLNISKDYILFVLGFIFYRIMLDLCYFNIVTVYYSYAGFCDYRSVRNFFISWIIFLLYLVALKKVRLNLKTSIKNIIIFFLSILSFIPFTTLVYAGVFNDRFVVLNFIYTMLIILLSNLSDNIKFPDFSLNLKNRGNIDALIKIIILISVIIVFYISYRYTGLRLNFDLSIIYDLRAEAREYNMPIALEYLFSWTKTINNILLIYCILERKKILSILLFIIQMLSFGIDGSKTTFFMAILCIILGFWRNLDTIKIKKWVPWIMTLFSFVGWLEYKILNSYYIVWLFLRRVLFLPVYLGSLYVDFFSKNTPDFFRSSFLRFFGFQTPYPDLDQIIGEVYFNSSKMGANNGLISDAITNFGIAGVIIMPFIFVLILKIIDACSTGVDERIRIYVALIYSISFTNSFLFTILLTHGLLVTIFILLLLSSYGNRKNNIMKYNYYERKIL